MRAQVPEAVAWAYPTAPDGTAELKLGRGPFKAPNGALLSGDAISKMSVKAMDWAPKLHPPAPAVVLGPARKNGPAPCAECHSHAGEGLVNIPDLAGLRAEYIIEQLHAFRSGDRGSARPDRVEFQVMAQVARAVSAPEIRAAADYFAKTPRRARIKVAEADIAPRTAVERFGWLYRSGPGAQPLNAGIVEVPQSLAGVYLYDPNVPQLAYVPKGALARGAVLVRTGGPGGQPCSQCHGATLRGTAIAPPLAGRDPSYLARALWDIRSGARHGGKVALMRQPANGLDPKQITDVAAYLASLTP